MSVKNNYVAGGLVGWILPLLAYLFSEVFFKDLLIAGKPGVLYLVAAAINLILVKFIFKTNADKAAVGMLAVTFLALMLAFIFKIKLH